MHARRFRRLAQAICLVLIVVVAAGVGMWYMHGGRILSVQTGSMAPAFKPGDGVLLQKLPAKDLRVGDIVSFRATQDPRVVISHRLIGLYPDGRLKTKGDALAQTDPALTSQQVLGRVVAVAPGYGRFIHLIRQPMGLLISVYLPALAVMAAELGRFSKSWHPIYRNRVYKNTRSTQT